MLKMKKTQQRLLLQQWMQQPLHEQFRYPELMHVQVSLILLQSIVKIKTGNVINLQYQ